MLGCAIECWDADLNCAVPVDEPGELVCTKPFPSMPVRFWNDPEFQLYRAAYFDKIPGMYLNFLLQLLFSRQIISIVKSQAVDWSTIQF